MCVDIIVTQSTVPKVSRAGNKKSCRGISKTRLPATVQERSTSSTPEGTVQLNV